MADRVGQHLGNYRLIRLLGRGGFAEVYLGEHLRLGTQAAVKVLYTRLASHDDVEGFEKEARMVAHLKHPHIVRVLDYDVQEDTPFLVMDYASGSTLRHRHPKRTCLPLTTIISYVKQVAEALQYAHDLRVIHRDIKPENMLVGEHDDLLLSDFGIATIAHSSHSLDFQQGIGGTLPYMAPEQIQGKPRLASDQYALAIVVYEWVAGQRPFQGTAVELAMQHAMTTPPSLLELVPTLPRDVEQVVLTALEKDPRKRFASVHAFAVALQTAAGLPVLDLRSANTSGVSDVGTTSSATASLVDEATQLGQTKGQDIPTIPPPAVVRNLEASARVPLSGNRFRQQRHMRRAKTVAVSLGTEHPSAIIELPMGGRTVSPPPLSVAQRKKALPSISITRFPPARKRLPAARVIVLGLLVFLLMVIGGIWATLYMTTLSNSQSSANIFQMTAIVGHGDSVNSPSVFFAFDLQGRATILELPGENRVQSRVYSGPLLNGSNVSVTLRFQKVIGASLPDMIVYAGQDIEVFENTGESFSPVSSSQVQQNKLPGPTSSNANYPLSWTSAVVGHYDSTAHPSVFLAVNVWGQIAVYEFRGGDAKSAIMYSGPDLFSSGEDQSVPTLLFSDRNHDGKDMILKVAGQQFVFSNNGTQFVPPPQLAL